MAGVTLSSSCRAVFLTFAVVMMRRDLGFSEGQVLYCTAGAFTGGLVSLYLWGRWVDRFGPLPLFRWTAFLQAATMVSFALLAGAGAVSLPVAVGAFFSRLQRSFRSRLALDTAPEPSKSSMSSVTTLSRTRLMFWRL